MKNDMNLADGYLLVCFELNHTGPYLYSDKGVQKLLREYGIYSVIRIYPGDQYETALKDMDDCIGRISKFEDFTRFEVYAIGYFSSSTYGDMYVGDSWEFEDINALLAKV